MTEPSETPRASLASEEAQRQVADLEWRLSVWRDIYDQEERMALAALTDNTYHTSGRYHDDWLTLQRLRRYAEGA